MEENTARVNEIEEIEPETEVEEAESSGGAFVAGIAGGFLAYALIGGVRKLVNFIVTKRSEQKLKNAKTNVVDAEYTPVEDDAEASGEDTTEE